MAFRKYPRRSLLCLALFVGQAFLDHGITFDPGLLLSSFYGVGAALAPLSIIVGALSNFADPVILGHFFDTVGRRPMIALAHHGSAVVTLPLAWVFLSRAGGLTAFMILLVVTFFLA